MISAFPGLRSRRNCARNVKTNSNENAGARRVATIPLASRTTVTVAAAVEPVDGATGLRGPAIPSEEAAAAPIRLARLRRTTRLVAMTTIAVTLRPSPPRLRPRILLRRRNSAMAAIGTNVAIAARTWNGVC